MHYRQSLDYCFKVFITVAGTRQELNILLELNSENISANFVYRWQQRSCQSSNLDSLPSPPCPSPSLLPEVPSVVVASPSISQARRFTVTKHCKPHGTLPKVITTASDSSSHILTIYETCINLTCTVALRLALHLFPLRVQDLLTMPH